MKYNELLLLSCKNFGAIDDRENPTFKLIEMLLRLKKDFKLNIDAVDSDGKTAIMHAASNGNEKLFKLLRGYKVKDINDAKIILDQKLNNVKAVQLAPNTTSFWKTPKRVAPTIVLAGIVAVFAVKNNCNIL